MTVVRLWQEEGGRAFARLLIDDRFSQRLSNPSLVKSFIAEQCSRLNVIRHVRTVYRQDIMATEIIVEVPSPMMMEAPPVIEERPMVRMFSLPRRKDA